jgi:hypothetical protein
VRQAWFVIFGAALCALGLAVAIRAALLMYDAATTTQVWMLREFGAGVCVAGWGVAVVIPPGWRRTGIALMGLGTGALVVAVMLLSQGLPA